MVEVRNMRLLVTADFDPEYLEILSSTLGSVGFDGWGKTGYLLTEAEPHLVEWPVI